MIKYHKSEHSVKESMAVFSPCMKYRYILSRVWNPNKKLIMFLMLNPSTADEMKNDPTVERCERRAKAMGYGGIVVCNIFAYRATSPKDMKAQDDPVGVENDQSILSSLREVDKVVCAWGGHGSHMKRADKVKELLKESGAEVLYLRMTQSGNPSHPLYIPYSEEPKLWSIDK